MKRSCPCIDAERGQFAECVHLCADLERGSDAYELLKEERSQVARRFCPLANYCICRDCIKLSMVVSSLFSSATMYSQRAEHTRCGILVRDDHYGVEEGHALCRFCGRRLRESSPTSGHAARAFQSWRAPPPSALLLWFPSPCIEYLH